MRTYLTLMLKTKHSAKTLLQPSVNEAERPTPAGL